MRTQTRNHDPKPGEMENTMAARASALGWLAFGFAMDPLMIVRARDIVCQPTKALLFVALDPEPNRRGSLLGDTRMRTRRKDAGRKHSDVEYPWKRTRRVIYRSYNRAVSPKGEHTSSDN